jgi:hypothetical protein
VSPLGECVHVSFRPNGNKVMESVKGNACASNALCLIMDGPENDKKGKGLRPEGSASESRLVYSGPNILCPRQAYAGAAKLIYTRSYFFTFDA